MVQNSLTSNAYRDKFVIPPYLWKEVYNRSSDPAQKQRALETLSKANQSRSERQLHRELQLPLPAKVTGKQRKIYDTNGTTNIPGNIVRDEGQSATGDVTVDETYEGLGSTYDLFDFYKEITKFSQRLSLIATVHYGQNYEMFWNGSQVVVGDGDVNLPASQQIVTRLTRAPDLIGHELTHGFCDNTARFFYQQQSGALCESFADVFGILVKQMINNQKGVTPTRDSRELDPNWVIGEGILNSTIKASGIRSLEKPGEAYDDPLIGADPQPDHMNGYSWTGDDNGGVHINSGIPNHAFYLAAKKIGGDPWQIAGKIWLVTLKEKLHPTSDFFDAARETVRTARELFGEGYVKAAVLDAWDEVGVPIKTSSPERWIESISVADKKEAGW